jgi:trimethylamine:corrinoid methyltransferase-like protein
VISPLRFGEDAVEVVYGCIAAQHPDLLHHRGAGGATAPATLAGFLAQSLAETLASLVMVHAIRPGFPMVFSNWPLVIDLRTGAFAGGGRRDRGAERGLGAAVELAGAALRRGRLDDRCQGHRRAIRHGKGA